MPEMRENDKTDPLTTLRKRLRFRSWHRGTREMDMILGRFADASLDGFDKKELELYDRLLKNSDPDLYNWLSGAEPVPPAEDNCVMQEFINFQFNG